MADVPKIAAQMEDLMPSPGDASAEKDQNEHDVVDELEEVQEANQGRSRRALGKLWKVLDTEPAQVEEGIGKLEQQKCWSVKLDVVVESNAEHGCRDHTV